MSVNTNAQAVVKELNVIDDVVFEKMAEDIGFCEEMISTIEGDEKNMCELVENYAKEYAEEYAKEKEKESARIAFEEGVSYEIVRKISSSLSEADLNAIYEDVMRVSLAAQ